MFKNLRQSLSNHTGAVAAAIGSAATFSFFLLAYPYHLMRREQMNLFLFDTDYIRQTYHGSGWMARFVCDFLDQFFGLPVVGPLVITLLLVAIGSVTYRICRKVLGKWPSLAIAAVVFLWSFFRETDNYFSTRYTIATLGYLSLVLLALSFRKGWMKAVAAALALAFGVWALAFPVHKYYGKPWGVPVLAYDKIIGLDTEVSREHWDKVIKRSGKDLYMTEASFCYNLANAMKGQLGKNLFNYAQNSMYSLLIWIIPEHNAFSNTLAGEAWFHLGDMTAAEQSAIIGLQASPKHTGVRYIKRLAKVNLLSGEYGAAQKYLEILSKTLFYGRWAMKMMPGRQDAATATELEAARSKLAGKDFVYSNNGAFRAVMAGLLEANPDNDMAREYLLCYDMLIFDLDHFAEVYAAKPIDYHTYQEAILVWLSQQDALNAENLARFGIPTSIVDRMDRFFMRPEKFRNTYWFYYMEAATRQLGE
ncbi:MAG: hypothetical protein J5639_08190 [Bacteroidales bacterium]|nr:hypothetical protein [Bacteroidales bacterium]